jgi:hypothetical protein
MKKRAAAKKLVAPLLPLQGQRRLEALDRPFRRVRSQNGAGYGWKSVPGCADQTCNRNGAGKSGYPF